MSVFTPEILSLSKNLLSQINNGGVSEDTISELKIVLNAADNSYYVHDKPVLADAEYDSLFATLKNLEAKHPHLVTSDSPTQRIASGLTNNFQNVAHLVPMLSLENSYDANDLEAWHKRCQEACPDEKIVYCVEPKYDGAGISLLYEKNSLARAATRGDGIKGDDITINAKQIRSIPLHASLANYKINNLEVRGEVLITKVKFAQYNQGLIEQGLEPLANPRNAASGSLRIKDAIEVGKRNLDAFLYHVSYIQFENDEPTLHSHSEILQMLEQTGFKSSWPNAKVCNSIDEVITYVQQSEATRDELPYEIDGMVIKVNSLTQQDKIGQTSHHPRWAMAYKFKARQATSKLLNVEYQVGRTGSVTPVAKIEPVYIGGVTVSSISLHNQEMIAQKDIRIGDTVLVERAGDVIPYIVKSFPELRNGSEASIEFPRNCPICAETLFKPEEEAVWRCVNIDCAAQVVERIIHFASKDAMDIRGLGDANIRKFFELGYLKNILGIYNLPYEEIKKMEGFGERSIDKLKEAIDLTKQQPLARVIFGLGIRYVGETTAKVLASSVTHISDLYHKSVEELRTLEDVGVKVAASIVSFFEHEHNRTLIADLENMGVQMHNTQKNETVQGGLSGKTFLFTGTLMQFKRSEAEAKVEALGGAILGSVSSKLNYLVVGEDAGSKLEKAKKLGNVHILSEAEFLDLMENAQ
jgi:DNA ligase (NAD+)